MGYSLIPLVASIILGVFYVAVASASALSKALVSVLLGASLYIWWARPQWIVGATVIEAGVSIYMILVLRFQGHEI